MCWRQWNVLSAVKTVKNVVKLLRVRVNNIFHVYVEIACDNDLTLVQRQTFQEFGKFDKKIARNIARARSVQQ